MVKWVTLVTKGSHEGGALLGEMTGHAQGSATGPPNSAKLAVPLERGRREHRVEQIRRSKAETRKKSESRRPNMAWPGERLRSPCGWGTDRAQGTPRDRPNSSKRAVSLGQGLRKGYSGGWPGVGSVRAGRRRSEWPLARTLAPQLTGIIYHGARLRQY